MSEIEYKEERYGKWVVLNKTSRSLNENTRGWFWKMRCECGTERIIAPYSIKNGKSKSCGCDRWEKIGSYNKETKTLEPGEAGFNYLFTYYKASARKRHFIFNLSRSEFRFYTKQNCYYCNIEPKQKAFSRSSTMCEDTRRNGIYLYNGIDRMDSNRGYEIDNCVPCCRVCNIAKNIMSIAEFKEWIQKVYNYLI